MSLVLLALCVLSVSIAGCRCESETVQVFPADGTVAQEQECQPDPKDQGEQIEVCKQTPTGLRPSDANTGSGVDADQTP